MIYCDFIFKRELFPSQVLYAVLLQDGVTLYSSLLILHSLTAHSLSHLKASGGQYSF